MIKEKKSIRMIALLYAMFDGSYNSLRDAKFELT